VLILNMLRGDKPEPLPASAGEEAPEREGRMDQSADQRLAEVLAAGWMAQRIGLREWERSCWGSRQVDWD